VAWSAAMSSAPADAGDGTSPARAAWRIALVARYWHFLLLVWDVLLAALAGLEPELVRAICGRG
jgi:cytochrome c oxidase subunit 3